MAPLPKRRHSSARQAKRSRALNSPQQNLVACPNCKALKLPHRVCPTCGFYKGKETIKKKTQRKKKA